MTALLLTATIIALLIWGVRKGFRWLERLLDETARD